MDDTMREFRTDDLELILDEARRTTQEDTSLLELMPEKEALFREQAARQAMAGNTDDARKLLSPLLADPQVQTLTDQMRDGHGGI